MKVEYTPLTAAEKRLVAAFMNDLADLQDLQVPGTQPAVEETAVEPPKKTTRRKTAEPAQTVAEPETTAAEPETTAEAVTQPATTAETAVESGSSETAEPVTHDTIRVLYGKLVAAGKRDPAVVAVRKLGAKSIKDIPDDKLGEIHATLIEIME